MNGLRHCLVIFFACLTVGQTPDLRAQLESVPEAIAIDHHVHLLSETLIADWKSLGMPFRNENAHYCDPETVLKNAGAKRAYAVSMAHLYASDWFARLENIAQRETKLVQSENDFIANCVAKQPDRLIGFFSINPRKEYSLAERERCLKKNSFRGMKLHLPACGIDLLQQKHLDALAETFDWCQTNKVMILIHPFSGDQTVSHVQRFWKLVERHSGLKMIIAHNGTSGGYSDLAHAILAGFVLKQQNSPNDLSGIYFDLSGAVLLEETEGMPATTDANCLRMVEMMKQVGWDRFLYASDYPVFTRDQMLTMLEDKLKLSPTQIRAIMDNRVR